METIQMDRLNGGRGECRAGSIVSDKSKPGAAYTVEGFKDYSLSGDSRIMLKVKTATGTAVESSPEVLVLTSHSELQALAQLESIREMVKALKSAVESKTLSGNEHADAIEKAQQAIQEDTLSVEVRSGWTQPGADCAQMPAAEFKILLCTGGPAVQIIGELNAGEPEKPRLQHQDWGTPWTDVRLSAEDEETLLAYCREFYFGE